MTSKITSCGIIVTQGDTLSIPLIFNQDITSATIHMQVRDANGKILIDKKVLDHAAPLDGKTLLVFEKDDTNLPEGTYETDMEIIFGDGKRYTFYPPKIGTSAYFTITKQVTRE